MASALNYYDLRGRTWERQAFIKALPVAGDLELGGEFLARMAPWVYGRYLSRADISGIKALKRRIEQQNRDGGGDDRNVKTGRGGIRDVEFVIQFLQLLNGGDLPALRTTNTLEAMAQLEHVGCLTDQERALLEENYTFLRRIEHLLQIMFDLQTHLLPKEDEEQRKLALRMGYADAAERPALAAFAGDYRSKTDLNRRVLDHLLHDAFSDDAATEAESDLVLDPDPPPERIVEVLGKYPLPRRETGLSQPDGAGRGEDPLPLRAALPALPGRHRPAVARGPGRHGRSRLGPGEPRQGERLAGRQGRALGTVQLQSAQPAALCRTLRLQPAPLRHPHQQPRHDRRPDGQPGVGQAAGAADAAGDAGRAVPRGRGHRPHPAQLQERPAASRGRPRLAGQGGRAGHDRGPLRHRRDLPGADRRRGIPAAGGQVRPAADRRRRPRRPALRNGRSWPWASSAAAK